VEALGPITMEDAERDHIRKTLEQTRWVVSGPRSAARLGIKRVHSLLPDAKLGISRTRDNPPGLLESLANVVSLRVLHGNWSKGFHFDGALKLARGDSRTLPESEDYAPLDEILKLANVAGPRVRGKFRHRFRGNAVDLLTHPAGIDLNKMLTRAGMSSRRARKGGRGTETHSNDSRDRCENRFASPFQPNFDGSQLRGERPLW